MNEGLIATRYARALLLSLASQPDAGRAVYEQAEVLLPVLEDNRPALRELLDNVLLPAGRKLSALNEIFARYAPSLQGFAGFMLRKGRGHFLEHALRVFLDLYRRQHGITRAWLTTTTTLDPAQEVQIKNYLKGEFGRNVEVSVDYDRGLIAGFTLRVGSRLLDRSVRGELLRIASELT